MDIIATYMEAIAEPIPLLKLDNDTDYLNSLTSSGTWRACWSRTPPS